MVVGGVVALNKMVSSTINQWALLMAMLPIVYSISRGAVSSIPFDQHQELELLMTIGQALVGMLFLVNMELAWWEAAALFGLWAFQFAFSASGANLPGGLNVHWLVTIAYFVVNRPEVLRSVLGPLKPAALLELD